MYRSRIVSWLSKILRAPVMPETTRAVLVACGGMSGAGLSAHAAPIGCHRSPGASRCPRRRYRWRRHRLRIGMPNLRFPPGCWRGSSARRRNPQRIVDHCFGTRAPSSCSRSRPNKAMRSGSVGARRVLASGSCDPRRARACLRGQWVVGGLRLEGGRAPFGAGKVRTQAEQAHLLGR